MGRIFNKKKDHNESQQFQLIRKSFRIIRSLKMHNLAIVLLIATLRTRFRTEKTLSQSVECLTILVFKELKQNVKKCESKTRNKKFIAKISEKSNVIRANGNF